MKKPQTNIAPIEQHENLDRLIDGVFTTMDAGKLSGSQINHSRVADSELTPAWKNFIREGLRERD